MDEGSFRASQPIEDLGEEGVEYAPSEEGDLMYQLGEKVRSQAQRLAALEQYRMLCENRILELAPDHPIPVLPDHLGNVPVDASRTDLHQAHQKIARLEQQLAQAHMAVPLSEFHSFPSPNTQLSLGQLQELYAALYFKVQALMGEKADLEESLRTEVLQTEEQRAYIEALKQALESKMEDLGFRPGNVDAFADLTQARTQLSKVRKEASQYYGALASQESDVQQLQEQLSAKTEESDSLQKRNNEIGKELKQMTFDLQQSMEELTKLEEEKSALLDYVQEHSEVEKALSDQKEKLTLEVKAERENHAKTAKALESAERQLKGLQTSHQDALTDRDHLTRAQSSLESDLQDVQTRFQASESRLKSLETQFQSVSDQAKAGQMKNERLQANNSTLSNTLQETQTELDQLRTTYNALLKEIKEDKEALIGANTKIRELQEQNRSLGTEVKLFEERVTGYDDLMDNLNKENQGRLQQFHDKQEQTIRENMTLKQRLRDIEAELASQKEDWMLQTNSFEGENKGLKGTVESLQNQLSSILKEKEGMEVKILEYREKAEEANFKTLQGEVKRLGQSAASAQRRIDLLTEENSVLRSQLGQAESDHRTVSEHLRDREKKLSEALSTNEALKSSLDSLQADLDKISSDTQTMAEEAVRARQHEQRASETLEQYGEELRGLRRMASQCGNVIAVFAGNFGAVSAATAAYSAVISEGFKDLIVKWGDWVEGEVATTAEGVLDWVKVSTEEVEALIRRVVELKADATSLVQRQSQYEHRLQTISEEESERRGKESSLSREVADLMDINDSLKRENELAYNRIESLTSDNVKSRREVQALSDELGKVKDQLSIYSVDTIKWKQPADTAQDMFAQKGLEEKVALLVREKKELELLLAKMQSAVPSNTLQRVFLDMMKSRSELEISERDRLRLENLLLSKESEMRVQTRTGEKQQAAELRKEVESLRQQLSNTETQIAMFKRQMSQLETDLQEAETVERRRYALQTDNEHNCVLLQEQLLRKNKELTQVMARPDFDRVKPAGNERRENSPPEVMKEESFGSMQSGQSIEYRLSRLGTRENRPRLTIQDKLSQAKAELSQLRRRPTS